MKKEQLPEISGILRNIMGTSSFMGKFPGMRKAQDFISTSSRSNGEDASPRTDGIGGITILLTEGRMHPYQSPYTLI